MNADITADTTANAIVTVNVDGMYISLF